MDLTNQTCNATAEQEDRIMELVQEHSIVPLLIKNTSNYHQFYSQTTKTCAAQACPPPPAPLPAFRHSSGTASPRQPGTSRLERMRPTGSGRCLRYRRLQDHPDGLRARQGPQAHGRRPRGRLPQGTPGPTAPAIRRRPCPM